MREFKLKGHLAMLGANMMWGMMAPVAKLAMAAGVITPLLLTNFRIFGATILFWIASLFTRRENVPTKDRIKLAGAGMLGIVLNQGCYIFGVGATSPGEASIITTTMPIWVMVLAAIILKEPITWKKAGGIALGACGGSSADFRRNSGCNQGQQSAARRRTVLCAQLCYALYLTFYRNFIKKYSVFTLMKWMFTLRIHRSPAVLCNRVAVDRLAIREHERSCRNSLRCNRSHFLCIYLHNDRSEKSASDTGGNV